MRIKDDGRSLDRRAFLKASAVAAAGGQQLLAAAASDAKASATSDAKASAKADGTSCRNKRPTMTYQKLGRTKIVSSRLVFGCGAALSGGKGVRLLDRAFEAGINHFDVGSNIYYKGSERALAPFLKAHRDDVWVVSKAPAPVRPVKGKPFSVKQAKAAVRMWTRLMDASLKDLQTDHVDAYYLMAVNNPLLIRSEEIYNAFLKAKAAGKVSYFGLSVHNNTEKVMTAAIETGWYDMVMLGITPGGWYDWDTKDLAKGTPPLLALQSILSKARKAGIGLVAMKVARHLAPGKALGKGDTKAFDQHYDKALMSSGLNPFQRSYVFVLRHGLDVANSDMQNFKHLEENITAAAFKPKA